MKRAISLFALVFVLHLFVPAQQSALAAALDEKLKEINAYAQRVMTDWKGPGMAIAIVKDDKVVFQRGYGVRWLGCSDQMINREPNASPDEAYRKLYFAVKSRDTIGIQALVSRRTCVLAEAQGARQNVPHFVVLKNGFTATTFSDTLPEVRDIRIRDTFAAVEVYNEKDSRWEDLPFILEDGGWRLAIAEIFDGTYQSPGKSQSQRELEANKSYITPTPIKPDTKSRQSNSSATARRTGQRNVIAESHLQTSEEKVSPALVDENTVFAVASNSKAFATAALAILVDENKLAWDDKVSKYLPDFQMYDPWVTSELTIRDLVTHRVGLDTFSGDLLWYETTYSDDEILKRVRHLKPVSSFRSRYGYQNLMFIAAGKVIERVSGKSWCEFVTERIFQPLAMNRTTCSVKNLPDNAAWPHNESGGNGLRVLHRGNVDGATAAAGLNSSVADLSKWVRTQLGRGKFEGKQIFSEAQSWQMHQPFLARQISESAWKNDPTRHFTGVASGWFVYDYHGRKIINHSGGLDGMLSYTVLIPEENAGFVVLTNNESPSFLIMMNKIRDVLVAAAPARDWNEEAKKQVAANKSSQAEEMKKVDAARIANTKPTLSLSSYAGTYSDKMYGDITVAEENGRLVMRFGPAPNFVADLEHWHYDTFRIKWRPSVAYNFPRGFVTFTIDKNGKTDELKIDQPNNDFWFYELAPKRVK